MRIFVLFLALLITGCATKAAISDLDNDKVIVRGSIWSW
jgi:hypothetical protein